MHLLPLFSPAPCSSGSPLYNNSHCCTLTLKIWEKGQWRALFCAIMSIWCYSRWERLLGSGQIRRREGSSRCWSRMMYCCSLWDSDNTNTKGDQGKGGRTDPSNAKQSENQMNLKQDFLGYRWHDRAHKIHLLTFPPGGREWHIKTGQLFLFL